MKPDPFVYIHIWEQIFSNLNAAFKPILVCDLLVSSLWTGIYEEKERYYTYTYICYVEYVRAHDFLRYIKTKIYHLDRHKLPSKLDDQLSRCLDIQWSWENPNFSLSFKRLIWSYIANFLAMFNICTAFSVLTALRRVKRKAFWIGPWSSSFDLDRKFWLNVWKFSWSYLRTIWMLEAYEDGQRAGYVPTRTFIAMGVRICVEVLLSSVHFVPSIAKYAACIIWE